MNDIVTVKDEMAAVLEPVLKDLGAAAPPQMAADLVRVLDNAGLVPTEKQYRRGGVNIGRDFAGVADQMASMRSEEVLREPPTDLDTEAGEYVLTQYATPWAKRS